MNKHKAVLLWAAVLLLVYILLIGVGVIGDGFKWISGGADGAEDIFAFATNPVVGVILGMLATALVQSSSTVTSVIVALVAGGVPVATAIPMVMGANMGTTITNTIVSVGNIKEGSQFKRSFGAATVHDFFNLYSIIIILPIEIVFHPLERMAQSLSYFLVGEGSTSASGMNILAMVTKPLVKWLGSTLKLLPETFGAVLMIIIGVGLVFFSVLYLGKLLRQVMTGKAKGILDLAFGKGAMVAIIAGAIITILVQSSSTTTSLVVPLAGAGVLTVMQIYPFTLGANIGTTITAVLAATSVSGGNELFALQIALVHLLYNVSGVILFAAIPFLWRLPVRSAEWLGNLTEKNRLYAFGYLLIVFFILPVAVLGIQKALNNKNLAVTKAESQEAKMDSTEQNVEESGLILD